MSTYPWATHCPIFSWFEATFWIASLHFASVHFNQEGKGVDTLGGSRPPKPPRRGRANYTFRHPADVKADFGLINPISKISVISGISGKSRVLRDFLTSNCSTPIRVWTCTKYSWSDDRLPLGYLLPDFQQIWSNFKIEIFQLQMTFESQYTHKSVDTQKLLCLYFLI